MKATEYGDVSLSLDLNDVLSDISLDVNIGRMLEEALQLGSRSDTHQIVAKDKNYHALSTSSVLPSLNLPQPPTSQPSPINISQPQLSPVNISQAQPLPSTITTHPTASLPLPNSQQSPGVPVPPAPVANTTWQPSLRKTLPLDTNSPSKRLEHTTSTSLEAPATPSKNTPPPSPQTNHPADSQVAHSAPLPSKAENMLRPQPQTEHLPAQSAVPPAAPTALPTKQILDSARETLPSPQAGHELDHILRESDSFEVGQIDIDAILSAIRNEQLRTVHSATPGVLKIDPMHRIASTLSSPTMKKEAGLPTSLCITSFIAIGMSHGVVLVFDLSENLRIIIGGTQVSEYGPVTSIDAPKGIIARDQAGWLLCGYQSGHVALWDVVSGKLLKIVNDAHSLPVLWVKFAGDNHRSLTVDSQGNMQLHDFTSRFFGINNEHVLVLSGKQIGVILSLEVLPSGFCSHATDTHCLFAFCTNQKVHLMGLGSGLSVKICQKTKLKKPESSPPGAIPYLAWRRACPPSNAESGNKVLDPILAVGWGLNIRLLQTVEDVIKGTNPEELNGIEFIAVGDYDIGTQINGLSWLGPEAIVMLGDNDVIRVWDPFSATFIESASSRKMELVYHSRIVHPSTKKPELSFSNCIFSTHKHVYLMESPSCYPEGVSLFCLPGTSRHPQDAPSVLGRMYRITCN
ncbi:Phosphatidylinositol transfer protein beta [Pelomyxa schiedti]|nr:Phosphatidylinositol transfer protein beta [Pelomyxa schiedti]